MKKYQDMKRYQLDNKVSRQKALEELAARYDSVSTIRLPFQIGQYPAFVMLNGELQSLMAAIYHQNIKLLRLSQDLPRDAVNQFAMSSMIEEIQQTNEVENVRSTRREIRDAVQAMQAKNPNKRFLGMVRKYQLLINHKDIPLRSCADVRKLYDEFILDEVLREDADNQPDGLIFRKGVTGVYSGHDQKIHEGLFPESRIIEAMEQGLSMLHDGEIDPMIRIAAFHYLFAYIHPFYDGNGRMTRFISSYMLSKEFSEAACLRIAYIIKSQRAGYYRLFKEANDKRNMGDITRFVIGFLSFFQQALEDAYTSLLEKMQAYHRNCQLLGQYIKDKIPTLDTRYTAMLEVMLQEELFGYAKFDIHALADMIECSEATVRKVMDQCGALVRYEVEKRKYYWYIDLDELENSALDA